MVMIEDHVEDGDVIMALQETMRPKEKDVLDFGKAAERCGLRP
jgi:hypothetical protein